MKSIHLSAYRVGHRASLDECLGNFVFLGPNYRQRGRSKPPLRRNLQESKKTDGAKQLDWQLDATSQARMSAREDQSRTRAKSWQLHCSAQLARGFPAIPNHTS